MADLGYRVDSPEISARMQRGQTESPICCLPRLNGTYENRKETQQGKRSKKGDQVFFFLLFHPSPQSTWNRNNETKAAPRVASTKSRFALRTVESNTDNCGSNYSRNCCTRIKLAAILPPFWPSFLFFLLLPLFLNVARFPPFAACLRDYRGQEKADRGPRITLGVEMDARRAGGGSNELGSRDSPRDRTSLIPIVNNAWGKTETRLPASRIPGPAGLFIRRRRLALIVRLPVWLCFLRERLASVI